MLWPVLQPPRLCKMEKMTLKNIAEACGGELFLTERAGKDAVTEETEILSAVHDSRQVTEGALFFATVGERVDGHSFLASVYEKGAVCAVTQKTPAQTEAEHKIPASLWGAYILVPDTLEALKKIAEYYRSTLHIPIVGVTGSVGKTSTKEFIASVLAQKYRVYKTEGNYNNEIGVPLTLLRIRKDHQAAVIEMGISNFGEMHRLSKMVRPNVCVITNIGQCHLENLGSRDGILKAKTEIFDYMDPEGQVCLNGDDDKLAGVTQVRGRAVHFFGLGQNPAEEVFAFDIVNRGLFGSLAKLCLKPEVSGRTVLPIEVPLPGSHMVINAAAAACVGQLLGLSGEEIAEGIRKVQPVGGRSHLIPLKNYTLIDDCYNANPVSMRAAIDLLNTADTVRTAILGDMFELGQNSDALHEDTGAYAAAAGLDRLICIGENARHMYEGAVKAGAGSRSFYFAAKEEFLKAFAQNREVYVPKHSTVLIKASHGMGFGDLVRLLQEADEEEQET